MHLTCSCDPDNLVLEVNLPWLSFGEEPQISIGPARDGLVYFEWSLLLDLCTEICYSHRDTSVKTSTFCSHMLLVLCTVEIESWKPFIKVN